jgi:gluconolactonase
MLSQAPLAPQTAILDFGADPSGPQHLIAKRESEHFAGSTSEVTVLFPRHAGTAPSMTTLSLRSPDLRIVYVGSLEESRITYFGSPIPGLPIVHWQRAAHKYFRQG